MESFEEGTGMRGGVCRAWFHSRRQPVPDAVASAAVPMSAVAASLLRLVVSFKHLKKTKRTSYFKLFNVTRKRCAVLQCLCKNIV